MTLESRHQPTGDRAMTTIETERLLLRQWRDEDYEPFYQLNSDPRVMEHFPALQTREQSDGGAQRLRSFIDECGWGLWATEVKGGAPFIGFIGLNRPRFEAHFTPCVEIGWRLAYEHWSRGYATEGARAALRFAFESLSLDEIISMTVVANRRSRNVMEKLGMVRDPEGDFDHPLIPAGHRTQRHVLYRISRAEWEYRHRDPTTPSS
ncbi:MAG: GNAT family N-acetyltransferase [Myxococcales bacterium]|nr:GNAT family N-acetyltransferase [Myxococcales bacterium]